MCKIYESGMNAIGARVLATGSRDPLILVHVGKVVSPAPVDGPMIYDSGIMGYTFKLAPFPPSPLVIENLAMRPNPIIAVMGATGTGKTTFINLVSGSNLRVGTGLHSCTSEVETALPFVLYGRNITLIDTPGFNDTTESDTTILKRISDFLAKQYSQGVKLAGIIYMHRISDFRMGGISTRNFKMFRSLCGDTTLKNVVIVTNMWGEVCREIGEAREFELANDGLFFKPVLDKQARMVRHDNTMASAQFIIGLFRKNDPKALQIQVEIIDEGKDNSQTAAAQLLNQELIEQVRKQEEEKRRVQADLEATMRQQAEARKAYEEAEQRRMKEEMKEAEAEARRQAAELQAEKERVEREMQEVAERARIEAERVAAEHQRLLAEEVERARQRQIAEEAERAALETARIRQEEEARIAREAEQRRINEEIERARIIAHQQAESARLERERLEREMWEAAERARVEAQRREAEHQQWLWQEAERVRQQEAAAAAQQAEIARQLAEAQHQAELERQRRRHHRRHGGAVLVPGPIQREVLPTVSDALLLSVNWGSREYDTPNFEPGQRPMATSSCLQVG
ncbi:hypothetical protein BDZ94DRAFT_1346171 [Collybia nuda]|uniref:G domain-containing protein n=1 Tax=Collybia nuda TaxID=64659 RepID=A0A9P5YAB7_9AGAR|nr:hypothetical protein BDZ94DRAFT_1346171 [Collybia nuda]